MNTIPNIIVLHVAQGYEEREQHISKMMAKHGLQYSLMLSGDIADISDQVLSEYFSDKFGGKNAYTSCTYKHLLAYQQILDQRLPGAIVMEDDVIIFDNFTSLVPTAIEQFTEAVDDTPAILSLEDTRLRFVERSRRHKGQLVYPGDRDRLAGCYYINRAGAAAIIDFARSNKIDRPIDTFHRYMLDRGLLKYWWMQPPVVTQGSFTGKFGSSLSTRYSRLMTPLVWQFKLNYRKLLYFFR